MKNLKEACGVFACYNAENAPITTFYGLMALQHRGQDSCGILWMDKDEIKIKRGKGLLNDVFDDLNEEKYSGTFSIGHVRYATTGGIDVANSQPFYFKSFQKEFAIAHNGNISNSFDLRKSLEERGSVFGGESDTEIIGHLLIRKKKIDLYDALLTTLDKLSGAFSLVLLDKKGIYAARDKWGFRPLCIGKKGDTYFVVSESCSLNTIGAKFVRNVEPGEVIQINDDGIRSSFYSKIKKKQQLCSMELFYFARPDSIIDGINIHEFRKISGKILAKLYPVKDADMVVPVPDSAISATLGYSEELKLPYERGLVKNRYISRTFIAQNEKDRMNNVRKKLNAVPHIIENKHIVLVDDSIVRGTTIKQIIKLLYENGARKIDVRIASPKIISPSYYGINISTYDELIAHHYKTNEEIAKFLDVNSVEFLPLKSLIKLAHPITLDLSIFTNKYITKISKEYIDMANKKKVDL